VGRAVVPGGRTGGRAGNEIDVVGNQCVQLADLGPAADGRWWEMNETCDRCGPAVGAAYRVDRVNRAGELYLCGHCGSRQWRALSAQGWTFWPLGLHALAPQASAASGGGPVQEAA
jgi:ribosomal protein S27AE